MEDVEDEVTFLLRLKPTPTPPIRKKINSYDTTSRKWDIIIEHHSSDVESTSSRHNSPVFSRRGLQDDQSLSPSMNRRSQQNEIYSNNRPPPLPPRWQPSAPPSEDEAHSYPKPLFEQQCSTQYVGKQDVNYLNFTPADAWMSSGYSGFPQASTPVSFVPSSIPYSTMEIQSQHRPNSSSYAVGNEPSNYLSRNPMSTDQVHPSGKPPFSPTLQQKFPRPPKPLPRSSVPREVQEAGDVGRSGRSTPGEQDEKVRKLQFEKDNLHLQVQVLTDQIEAQSYKISDLEKTLQDKKHCLVEAEEKLQREMLSRSSLETQKLELMSIISDLKLQQAAAERENMELRNNLHMNNNGDLKKPTLLPRNSPQPHSALTPIQHTNSGQGNTLRVSPSPSPITSLNSTRRSETNYCLQDLQPPKTPPSSYKRQIDIHYASLPRQQFLSNGGNISSVDFNANPASNGSKKAVAFGRGFTNLIGVRSKGFSVPNLAQTEKGTTEENNGDASQLQIGKNKGIKKIFGKIKRSGSGNLEDLPGVGEFQRGGVRATAAARLGWSEPQLTQKPDKPFSEWDTENICDWLQDLGLDQYIPEARKWVKNGQQLQECAIAEIEKELIIKNPLHKKKLQLALIDAEENGSSDPYLSKAGELDTAWVLRWLDDVGLPQHKESFLINRVDGRVLHRLTVDDLGVLHVTSLLHVASIKRGIQVLRENDYSAACLKRRSVPDEGPPTPNLVSLWTTHRVMEWLRAVDLAEYAPNLRGAGVHGGLMVHETKFTAELLASLLSIPPGKTLLRRHLNTHFKELLGRDIIQEKRDAQSTMGYIPLTPTAKLKTTKKSQFSLKRKKSKGEADYGDLVCPLNPEKSGEMNGSALNSSMGMRRINQEEEDVYHLADKGAKSLPASVTNSPIPFRNVKQ